MSGWGIADTAPKIEKIKAESADYLNGLNSCGKIEWSIYSEMFDFYADLIEEAYAQGKEDAQPEIKTEGDTISRRAAIDALERKKDKNAKGDIGGFYNKIIQNDIDTLMQLPSAQPERIRINLNEPIKAKLTDWGKEIYYHQYDKFPKEDENGYTEFQLWCFMELYGDHMGMTLPNVIKPFEIVYER